MYQQSLCFCYSQTGHTKLAVLGKSLIKLWGLYFAVYLLATDTTTVGAVSNQAKPNTSVLLPSKNNTKPTTISETLRTLKSTAATGHSFSNEEGWMNSISPTQHSLGRTERAANVSVDSYDLRGCGETWTSRNITVKDGTKVHMFYDKVRQQTSNICSFTLQSPPRKILLLQLNRCQSVVIRMTGSTSMIKHYTFSIHCVFYGFPPVWHSLSSLVNIHYQFTGEKLGNSAPSFLSLYVSAVDESERPLLEHRSQSPSGGYIQTPGWNRITPYPALMLSCVTLTPPNNHVIFASFYHLQISDGDYVNVTPWQCLTPEYLFQMKKTNPSDARSTVLYRYGAAPKAHIFPDDFYEEKTKESKSLYIVFSSDDRSQLSGFRLQYSFYDEENKPRRLKRLNRQQSQQWNCSASHWPGLSKLFPCDLIPQCAESEDEAVCPYTTQDCGINKLQVGERCYVYKTEKHRSWMESDMECRQLGGLLVNMETEQKWEEVTKILDYSHEYFIWTGLKAMGSSMEKAALPSLYAHTWEWLSGSVAYYLSLEPKAHKNHCGRISRKGRIARTVYKMETWFCEFSIASSLLCEFHVSSEDQVSQPIGLSVPSVTSVSHIPLVACPLQHMVHEMLACDINSLCEKLDISEGWHTSVCKMAGGQPQPYFYCDVPGQFVPYSLVCDFREDCTNGGDEYFCFHPPCKGNMFNCGQGQCVDLDKHCDGREDCKTGSDEVVCPESLPVYYPVKPLALVKFDRPGGYSIIALPNSTTQCPDTHFQCTDGSYCLPVFVRCNGVNDCPGHEDEILCSPYRCPRFYRCRGHDKTICMHVHHLCDGWPQCPQQDDEILCSATCPEQCTCSGLAFTCTAPFHVSSFPQVRYLDARGSRLHQENITHNIMLIHLGVQACGWSSLKDFKLFNLHSLDLSDNLLRHINFSHFRDIQQLRRLSLAHNPVSVGLSENQRKYVQPSLLVFNVSGVQLGFINMTVLATVLSELQVLDLSQGGEVYLQGQPMFQSLHVLDLSGTCVSHFSPKFMKSMNSLQQVFVDHFILCCQTVLPDVFLGECSAPANEISSCDDLLKSNVHRFVLVVFTVLSIFGNFGSFVYRLCTLSKKKSTGFALFVVHLCISDFLMGIYLAFIGLADMMYAGVYVWSETKWKMSILCRFAGFLSLLSSEVSAFIICLITLDRFIVLRFPFSQFRFRGISAHIACMIVWMLGIILASVPLLPVLSHWKFYQQTGICIPLPVTRADFPGHGYSFSVMTVCNFHLFVLIAVGQCMIFWSVKANIVSKQKAGIESTKSKETAIATRLFYIAITDFLCWFPIGLCGLLAGTDVVISEKVNVALAIFVLPLNSAINPFIYTMNVMRDKWRKAQELRLQKFIQAHLNKQLRTPAALE